MIELSGAVAIWVAGVCVAAVVGGVSPLVALVLSLVAMVLYVLVLAVGRRGLEHVRLPPRWITWLGAAVAEEELELEAAIRPRRGTQHPHRAGGGEQAKDDLHQGGLPGPVGSEHRDELTRVDRDGDVAP